MQEERGGESDSRATASISYTSLLGLVCACNGSPEVENREAMSRFDVVPDPQFPVSAGIGDGECSAEVF